MVWPIMRRSGRVPLRNNEVSLATEEIMRWWSEPVLHGFFFLLAAAYAPHALYL